MNGDSALLIMDYQVGVLAQLPDGDALAAKMSEVRDDAKDVGVKAIYVTVGFRPGHPEVSSQNKMFSGIASHGGMVVGSPEAAIHPHVSPENEDPVVIKHRVGAFRNTDLLQMLRAHQISKLALAGVATKGVVLSTLRDAADLDFQTVVLRDLCGDVDDEVQEFLMNKVFPVQADVLSSEAWVESLTSEK